VLSRGSAAVILYHNHPSGVAEPSLADQTLTRRLKIVLSLIDVEVLDHLIVAEKVFSFSAAGIL
jgi:DNA repair protein RadC